MKWPLGKGKTLFLALTVAAVLLVVIMAIRRPPAPETMLLEEQRISVTVLRVEPRSVEDAIILPARVEPFTDVTVAAEQAGRVMELSVSEGDMVREGDRLLRIDDRLWLTGLQRAELAVRDARREFERVRELRRTGAVSQSVLDDAGTRLENAELALREADVQLEKCTPASPLSGVVAERLVSAGETVSPGRPLFRLLDIEKVKIVFDVPEKDVHALLPEAAYEFSLDALPETVFYGKMRFIAVAGDNAGNAFRAELWSDNPQSRIRPGMIARVRFVRRTLSDAVVLPLRAVVPMKGETVVYVVADGNAVRRIVRLGAIIDGQVLIQEGVSVGEAVILDGNRAVLDGTPVNVVEKWQPAPVPES